MKKNILQRFLYGINLSFGFSMLPIYVFNFHNYLLTRYCKTLGNICIILVFLGYKIINKLFFFYFILPLAFLMLIYKYVINIIGFCTFLNLLNSKRLDKKDKIVKFNLYLVICIRGICQIGLCIGATIGLDLSIYIFSSMYEDVSIFKSYLNELSTTIKN
jgi:hypothetical protein